jgi:hypothetical protein
MLEGVAAQLGVAFDRIEDFLAVQAPLSTADLGPVRCLQEAVGIGEQERILLAERIPRIASDDHASAVVLLGLFAQQR